MSLCEVFQDFVKESPLTVMMRASMENVFSAERLDRIFDETRARQKAGETLFSLVADLMMTVVCAVQPSVNAAYKARKKNIEVSVKSIYNKLNGIETRVSREVVRQTAEQLAALIDEMDARFEPWLPGYRVKILDGNHLPRSERRLKELRALNAAPLPGHSLVVLDPERMLAIDVFPCEDGHAQERTLLPQVLDTIEQGDVLVADRNFCTMHFLRGIADRHAGFIIRQHGGGLRWERIGTRRSIGRIATGVVYEQWIELTPEEGDAWLVRRVTVELDEPTRDGDTEIHILSNLPESIDARRIAEVYALRWTLETAFQELEATLNSELQTLAYPQAALFAFCMALNAYNILSVLKAALRAAHGAEKIENEVSAYYMANEIATTMRGMTIALPSQFWEERFGNYTLQQMAEFLIATARGVYLPAFKKQRRGPKKNQPKLKKKGRAHVSTAKILKARSNSTKC